MKSNIRYVSNKEKNQKEKILDLINSHVLEMEGKIAKCLFPPFFAYLAILYSKYIIEKEGLNPFPIINGELDQLSPYLKEKFNAIGLGKKIVESMTSYKLYEVLKKIIFEDYEIEIYKDRVLDSYIDKNKKYLLISNYDIPYINYSNVDIITNNWLNSKLFYNKIFDEITGINRIYYDLAKDAIDFTQYESIIYINDGTKYIDYENAIFNNHNRRLRQCKDIFMITKYTYISYYNNFFENIESIMLDKEKAYIKIKILPKYKSTQDKNSLDYVYTVDQNGKVRDFLYDYKVNIKELSNISNKDLVNIIKTNKEIENISIYVEKKDVLNNCRRIGFSSYNHFSIDRSKLLRLVDYNRFLTEKIKKLDNEISVQIDKMFVR